MPYLNSCYPQEVLVINASFLDYDWSDGDVLFANSTCFDDELVGEIAKKAHKLKPGEEEEEEEEEEDKGEEWSSRIII